MRIEGFAEKVRGAMEKELGDGYRIECREVRKNNGVIQHGLTVLGRAGTWLSRYTWTCCWRHTGPGPRS